jgi:S-formylglutathione hydrolase FrmB
MARSWSRTAWCGAGILGGSAIVAAGWLASDHWTEPAKWSIVGLPFLALLGLVATTAVVASWLPRRRWKRWTLRLVAVAFLATFAAAAVNAHYGYLPTVDALMGRHAADEMSLASFRRAEQRPASVLRARGTVIDFPMPGTVSGFRARTGQVYLPPAWFQTPRPALPVIELLHGSPGAPADWTRAGFADIAADAYAREHHGMAPIIVMPDVNGGFWRDTECVDGPHGNAETYLTQDVRRAVVERFGARDDRAGWSIGGLSEGGYCASMLALRHPDLYVAAASFSGDDRATIQGSALKMFGGSWAAAQEQLRQHDIRVLLREATAGPRPAMWFSAGSGDGLCGRLQRADALARELGYDSTFVGLNGSHNFRVWKESFARALPWFMARFNVVDAQTIGIAQRGHPFHPPSNAGVSVK